MDRDIPWFLTESGLWFIGLSLGAVGINYETIYRMWTQSLQAGEYFIPSGSVRRDRRSVAVHMGLDYVPQVLHGNFRAVQSELFQDFSISFFGLHSELYVRIIFFLYQVWTNQPPNNLFFVATMIRRAYYIARELWTRYWSSRGVQGALTGQTLTENLPLLGSSRRTNFDFFDFWVRRARNGIPLLISAMVTGGTLGLSLTMRYGLSSDYLLGQQSGQFWSMLLIQQMMIGIGAASLGAAHLLNANNVHPGHLLDAGYRAVRGFVEPHIVAGVNSVARRLEAIPGFPFRLMRAAIGWAFSGIRGQTGRAVGTSLRLVARQPVDGDAVVRQVESRIIRTASRSMAWLVAVARIPGQRVSAIRRQINRIMNRAIYVTMQLIGAMMTPVWTWWMRIMAWFHVVYFDDFLGELEWIPIYGRLFAWPLRRFGELFEAHFPRIVRSVFNRMFRRTPTVQGRRTRTASGRIIRSAVLRGRRH